MEKADPTRVPTSRFTRWREMVTVAREYPGQWFDITEDVQHVKRGTVYSGLLRAAGNLVLELSEEGSEEEGMFFRWKKRIEEK